MAKKASEWFKRGVIQGMGWALGSTIGFVILIPIVIFVLGQLGGLPVVGNIIASVVEATQTSLLAR